jgi:selenocysteine lyase/cysteine desulfurase
MTPLPLAAIAAGEAGLRRKARPFELTPADFFEESERARVLLARLAGGDPEGVAIVPAASYGLAVAAANLPTGNGRRILVLKDQFPSHVYPWRRLAAERGGSIVTVDHGPGGNLTTAVLGAIDARTAIVAVPQIRWTDGRCLDLVRIGAACRDVGAALVLDLTQSLGVMPFDLAAVRPNFVVAAGYKWLMGPYSLAWLWVAPQHRDGRPLEETWIGRAGSEDFAGLIAYTDAYQPGARRYDVGERANFALLPAAVASLELLLGWGVDRITAALARATAEIVGRVTPLGVEAVPAALRGPHYLGLRLPAGAPADLAARLAARGVHVSVRGAYLRVTPHVYNDAEDVARLVEALTAERGG